MPIDFPDKRVYHLYKYPAKLINRVGYLTPPEDGFDIDEIFPAKVYKKFMKKFIDFKKQDYTQKELISNIEEFKNNTTEWLQSQLEEGKEITKEKISNYMYNTWEDYLDEDLLTALLVSRMDKKLRNQEVKELGLKGKEKKERLADWNHFDEAEEFDDFNALYEEGNRGFETDDEDDEESELM